MALTLMQSIELILFMVLVLAASMLGLSASGQFPFQHRTKPFRSTFGILILFGSILLSAGALVACIYYVHASVPWYALVIGGGMMVLITPLVLRVFSDEFVDGRASVLAFSSLAVAACGALAWLH